jgi:hypothetical protein
MYEVLTFLPYLPDAILLAVGLAILWRNRLRSRKATTLALAALCGLGGLWLFAIGSRLLLDLWQGFPPDTMAVVIHVYDFLMRALGVTCILLLVLAVVADRAAPGRARDPGPAADFDDAPRGRAPG